MGRNQNGVFKQRNPDRELKSLSGLMQQFRQVDPAVVPVEIAELIGHHMRRVMRTWQLRLFFN